MNVLGIGNALVDVQARVPDALVERVGYEKGVMTLVDDTAQAKVLDVLNQQFGPPINRYAFANIPELKVAVAKVISNDKTLPRNYDPRWVVLHGMQAFTETKIQFAPESEWKDINAKTRKDYESGFQQAMKSLK